MQGEVGLHLINSIGSKYTFAKRRHTKIDKSCREWRGTQTAFRMPNRTVVCISRGHRTIRAHVKFAIWGDIRLPIAIVQLSSPWLPRQHLPHIGVERSYLDPHRTTSGSSLVSLGQRKSVVMGHGSRGERSQRRSEWQRRSKEPAVMLSFSAPEVGDLDLPVSQPDLLLQVNRSCPMAWFSWIVAIAAGFHRKPGLVRWP